jgi:UDP-2,3-diacylglucosamine pyrophosphatase LpxH
MKNGGGWQSGEKLPGGGSPDGGGDRSVSFHRSIWISDLHLGTRRCKAKKLLEFLVNHRSEVLYLVGDVVDGWNVGDAWCWSADQEAVVQQIATWARHGGRVVCLPGNHDEASTAFVRERLGPRVRFRPHLIHRTVEGRRMLVIHGHQFDRALNPNRWNWIVGSRSYGAIQRFSEWYSSSSIGDSDAWERPLGGLRARVKRAVELITDFRDQAVADAAREHRSDGVICGHIHRAEEKTIGDVLYINDGDWVHSCTALVEDLDGGLRLVEHDHAPRSTVDEPPAVAA